MSTIYRLLFNIARAIAIEAPSTLEGSDHAAQQDAGHQHAKTLHRHQTGSDPLQSLGPTRKRPTQVRRAWKRP